MFKERKPKDDVNEIRWDKMVKDHQWLTIRALNEKSLALEELVEEFMKFEISFGGPSFLFDSEDNPSYQLMKLTVIEDLDFFQKNEMVIKKDEIYHITPKGEEVAKYFADRWKSVTRLANKFFSPSTPPLISLIFHFILGILKLVGFALTGSVGLLGDGIDSTIDGISSIIVSISIRIKKERIASYFLLLLMIASGVGILYESIDSIIETVKIGGQLDSPVFALVVASVSIFLCLILYLYQRIVGYTMKNLTILVQSEDSRNHILVGLLVLIGVVAGYFNFFILDGIVGLIIGLLILRGCYAIFQDIRAISRGETIDFEKYKLGMWKRFDRFRANKVGLWILFMLKKGVNKIEDLENNFNTKFRPQFFKFLEIEIKPKKEDKITEKDKIRFYQTQEEMTKQIDLLVRKKWIIKRNDELFILPEGDEELKKQLEIHSRNHKRRHKKLERKIKRS